MIRRREALLGASVALAGRGDAGAVTTRRSADARVALREIGEMGLGTWSWGNTAVWVRARATGG